MRFWILPNSGLETVSHMRLLLDYFRSQRPDLEIEITVLTRQSLWQKLFLCQRGLLPAAQRPDIVQIPHYWTALFSRLGLLENLSLLLPSLCDDCLLEPLRANCYMPGSSDIYSYPWWMDVSALHYRVDHLENLGIEPEKAMATWDGFLKVCGMLQQKRGGHNYFPLENANIKGTMTARDVLPFIWNRGGDIFSTDMMRSTIHREEVLRGIEDYLNLFRRGYMPLMREKGSIGTLSQGRASMSISRRLSPITQSEAAGNRLMVRTIPIPGDIFGSQSFLSSYNLAILASSQHKEDAAGLLRWMTAEENMSRYCNLVQAFPCTAAGFEKFIFSSSERMGTYAQIVAGAKALPNMTVCGTYMEIIDEVLDRISHDLAAERFSSSLLLREMVKVQVEVDFLISLYGH